MYGELGYLNLIRQIIRGRKQVGRNGITYKFIGEIEIFFENNKIPLMTTKKLAWRVCLKELLWFINGDTNNKILKGTKRKNLEWKWNKRILDSRGLNYLKEDAVYGHQLEILEASYVRN